MPKKNVSLIDRSGILQEIMLQYRHMVAGSTLKLAAGLE